MRLATWNIRAGGGARTDGIASALLAERPDVLVLTEVRPRSSSRLLDLLAEQGYRSLLGQVDSAADKLPLNHTCVLSLHDMEPVQLPCLPLSTHRWVAAHLPALDLTVLGAHVPNQTEIWNKVDFWQSLEAFTSAFSTERAVLLGDLNTALDEDCEGDPIREAVYLKRLLASGWIDAWRQCNADAREFSWYSHRANGFRLDHCFVSPALAPLVTCSSLRHDVRLDRLSDHSLLLVELGG